MTGACSWLLRTAPAHLRLLLRGHSFSVLSLAARGCRSSALAAIALASIGPAQDGGLHHTWRIVEPLESKVSTGGGLLGLPFSTGFQGGGVLSGWGVSHDATNDVFLVAWTEVSNQTLNDETYGRLVSPSGDLIGPLLCLNCSVAPGSQYVQGVANVDGRDAFVVWINRHNPVVVDAATGTIQTVASLSTGSAGLDRAAISGSRGQGESRFVAVRVDLQPPEIVATSYDLGPSGTIVVSSSVRISTWSGAQAPEIFISKDGGESGRRLVVWDEGGQILGAVLDRDLNIVDQGPIRVSAETKYAPVVDGDGRQWVVSYGTPNEGVKSVPVFWDSGTSQAWVGPEVIVDPGTNGFTRGAAWVGESVLVGSGVGSTSMPPPQRGVVSIDPFTCEPCQGRFLTTTSNKKIAHQPGGDIAFLSDSIGVVQRFQVNDGITTDLGGGCGSGGWAAATCAIAGNQDFTLRLRDAARSTPAFVALGGQRLDFPCGTCTLVPNPIFVVGAGLTNAVVGNAELKVPLANDPALIGGTFLMQWLTVTTGSCSLGLEFSNALSVQIQ